jgi:hypothetical protein
MAKTKQRGVFPRKEKQQTVLTYARRIEKKFDLRITSLYRSPQHNAAIGGAPNSYHTKGLAVDFVPADGNWSRLDRVVLWVRLRFSGKFVEVLWRTSGHYDHLHLAFKPGKAKPSRKVI